MSHETTLLATPLKGEHFQVADETSIVHIKIILAFFDL